MKRILGLIQLFVGISAFTGSLPILTQTNREAGLTSGQNFFIQGLLLLLMVAIPNLVASYFTLNNKRKTEIVGLIAAIVLLIWLGIHYSTFGYQSIFQIFYLAMVIAELLIVRQLILAGKQKN